MKKEKITPEEKLLKIIENPQIDKQRISVTAIKRKIFNPASLISSIKGIRIDRNLIRRLNINAANKIAVVLCVLISIFWIYDSLNTDAALKRRFEAMSKVTNVREPAEEAPSVPEVALNDLLARSKTRNIFTLIPAGAQVEKSADLSGVKLVGILWSDNPQAMIEDTKEKKTSLLSAGDSVGNFKIKDILKNKVVIMDENLEEWELR